MQYVILKQLRGSMALFYSTPAVKPDHSSSKHTYVLHHSQRSKQVVITHPYIFFLHFLTRTQQEVNIILLKVNKLYARKAVACFSRLRNLFEVFNLVFFNPNPTCCYIYPAAFYSLKIPDVGT